MYGSKDSGAHVGEWNDEYCTDVMPCVCLVSPSLAVVAVQPICPTIDVAASTTTAGASCAGGAASGSPTCTFSCAPTYSIVGSDTITCRINGEQTGAA